MLELMNDREFKINCPRCHYDYTHHHDVWIYDRENDQEDAQSYVYEHQQKTTTKTDTNPSLRRDAATFLMSCEQGHEFLMHVIQHKGQTIIEFD